MSIFSPSLFLETLIYQFIPLLSLERFYISKFQLLVIKICFSFTFPHLYKHLNPLLLKPESECHFYSSFFFITSIYLCSSILNTFIGLYFLLLPLVFPSSSFSSSNNKRKFKTIWWPKQNYFYISFQFLSCVLYIFWVMVYT